MQQAKPKKQFVTLAVESSIGNTFKDFADHAGIPVSRATEMALRRWMLEGCLTDVAAFKAVMGTGKHDLFRDMTKDAVNKLLDDLNGR